MSTFLAGEVCDELDVQWVVQASDGYVHNDSEKVRQDLIDTYFTDLDKDFVRWQPRKKKFRHTKDQLTRWESQVDDAFNTVLDKVQLEAITFERVHRKVDYLAIVKEFHGQQALADYERTCN